MTSKVDLSRLQTAPDFARVRVREVAALAGVSVASAWRLSKTGQLPAPQKLGGATTWNLGELRRCLTVDR